MSAGALAALADAETGLIAALDAGEVVGIERATAALAERLATVRGVGAWSDTAETRLALLRALRLIDAAGARTNFLADQARRRLDALMRARGAAPRIGYTRMAQGAA